MIQRRKFVLIVVNFDEFWWLRLIMKRIKFNQVVHFFRVLMPAQQMVGKMNYPRMLVVVSESRKPKQPVQTIVVGLDQTRSPLYITWLAFEFILLPYNFGRVSH